jgi:hypothetical protein
VGDDDALSVRHPLATTTMSQKAVIDGFAGGVGSLVALFAT